MNFRYQRFFNCIRSPAHLYTEYQVWLAKKKFRDLYPQCEICGLERDLSSGYLCDIHHIIPVHVRLDLACDEMNLITLCRVHHWMWGHFKNWNRYNLDIRNTSEEIRYMYIKISNES